LVRFRAACMQLPWRGGPQTQIRLPSCTKDGRPTAPTGHWSRMRQHRYRITLEHLATAKGEPGTHEPLVFEARNHDDLFEIIARIRSKGLLAEPDQAASLALGLKLLAEVTLE